MGVRKNVKCSLCGKTINRVTWNYAENRPMVNFFCNNICKGSWQKNQREALGYTKEWLISEYLVKGKSSNQIAKEIGRDPKGVWQWIKDYGISTRPRGTDYGQCFKRGAISAFKGMSHSLESKQKIRDARLRDGGVPYLKNGEHWLKTKGAIHPNWKGGMTPERQSFYSSSEWADAVKKIWKRDNAVCQRCGKNHNTTKLRGTFHIHHIISFMVREKRSDVDNLILLCADCHRWVHSKKNINKEFIKELS